MEILVYAILNAYMAFENEDILTNEQKINMNEGFEQIRRGEFITASEYLTKRGLQKTV